MIVSFTIGELKEGERHMVCPYCGADLTVRWDEDIDSPLVLGNCKHLDPEYDFTTHDIEGFELPEDQIKVNFYFEP